MAESQSSMQSVVSSVPDEIALNQDDDFLDKLNDVDQLYYSNTAPLPDILLNVYIDNDDNSESDEEPEVVNDESDIENVDCVLIEQSVCDSKEQHEQSKFKTDTCKCKEFYSGIPCSKKIDWDSAVEFREHCQELSHDELDMTIKVELACHRRTGEMTMSKKHKISERQRPYQEYWFCGNRVCRKTFCFLHGIERKKLQAIAASLDKDGLKPRVHGLCGKSPKHSLTLDDTQRIKIFIVEFAKRNGLPLPGRLPNYKSSKVLLLPSDTTAAYIHKQYESVAEELNYRSVSLRTFQKIWHDHAPYILVMKPCTDLCQKCQEFSYKISNAGNLTEEEKKELLEKYQEHISLAKKQRDYYRDECLASKEVYNNLSEDCKKTGKPACSLDIKGHYSWDFAQQIHYPHHAQQVGPIYFKTPRKCDVFGICSEGSGKQIFFLIDEAESAGKGSEAVISMAHHYFEHHSLGEKQIEIHFDNCGGQNKNNFVLWYGLWRVLTGLHEIIQFSTMVAGHTKFAPDWHFGIWKNKWRTCNAETLEEIAETVSKSSDHNIPQLIKDEDKPVRFYRWKTFLKQFFRPLPNLSKYHHFRFCNTNPEIIHCKEHVDSETVFFNLLKRNAMKPIPNVLPELLDIAEMEPTRQWYLYENIREHCLKDIGKETVCPKPTVPKPKAVKLESEKCTVPLKRKQSLLN